jgi:hypothetical protein
MLRQYSAIAEKRALPEVKSQEVFGDPSEQVHRESRVALYASVLTHNRAV